MMKKREKKLFLVMPPNQGLLQGFSAGLISLANFVQKRIPEVHPEILDLSIDSYESSNNKLVQLLEKEQNTKVFVGITTTTASYQSALKIADFVKKAKSKSVIILGGHHASTDPENILRAHQKIVDLIVMGEGEKSLYEILCNYPSLNQVRGIAIIDENGNFTCTSPAPLLSQNELDSISITYRNHGLIGIPGKFDYATYVSARGCPHRCSFCVVGDSCVRTKSISAFIRDIRTLLKIGHNRISIEDNFFAQSYLRTRQICQALEEIQKKNKDNFKWDCQTRLESLAKRDTIILLAKAGCEAVYIGVDALNTKQLLYLNKTKNPLKYLNTLTKYVVPTLLQYNIKCYLNLQFGLPFENDNERRNTIEILTLLGKLASSFGQTITVFPQLHVIYPGTSLFRQALSQGRFSNDVFEKFTEWEFQQNSVLYWLGEHFAHGAGGIPEGIIKPEVLRNSAFGDANEVIDTNAVFNLSASLRAINRIKGLKTFNYGDHIIKEQHPIEVA